MEQEKMVLSVFSMSNFTFMWLFRSFLETFYWKVIFDISWYFHMKMRELNSRKIKLVNRGFSYAYIRASCAIVWISSIFEGWILVRYKSCNSTKILGVKFYLKLMSFSIACENSGDFRSVWRCTSPLYIFGQ